MRHVVNFSGGLCSWLTARRVKAAHGIADLVLLFADTLIEDPDLYRFNEDVARDIGVRITRIADGRTPWEVFRDERFLGNARIDPCSKILKRHLLDRWHRENCDPLATTIYVGLMWDEGDRFERFRRAMAPWQVSAPMVDAPYLSKHDMIRAAEAAGIRPPALYLEGFPHNNCGGGCVKAGQAQFALLLNRRPETFRVWENGEQRLRDFLGQDVAILRDRTGGQVRPLTLRELRERLQAGAKTDEFDWGGCGCATE